MKESVVYKNGVFVDSCDAVLSVYSGGVMYGNAVFEMTRSFNKNHFKLEEHIDRLFKSSNFIHVECPIDKKEMLQVCQELCSKNEEIGFIKDDDEYRLMINLSQGGLSIYKEFVSTKPDIIITVFPLRYTVVGMDEYIKNGINICFSRQKSLPYDIHKHRSRIHLQQANIEASNRKLSNTWPLLTDPHGYITECSGANFFIIKNGIVSTPKKRYILPGISRQYVIDMLRDIVSYIHSWQFPLIIKERNILPEEVFDADEAFVTATPFCILPVTSIEGYKLPGDGTATKALVHRWSGMVNCDFYEQILRWNKEMQWDDRMISPYVNKA
jgi:branched-chain amino acid aminotransferase